MADKVEQLTAYKLKCEHVFGLWYTSKFDPGSGTGIQPVVWPIRKCVHISILGPTIRIPAQYCLC